MTRFRSSNKTPRLVAHATAHQQPGSGAFFQGLEMTEFFDKFIQFEHQMDQSRINLASIPQRLLGFKECPDCGDLVHTIRYRNEVRYIVAGAAKWSWHQCPQPVDPDWSDDAQQRDGDGRLR